MITRVPHHLRDPREQARWSLFQIRRGPWRRAAQRMLACRTCEGVGGYAITMDNGRKLGILCGDCGGGRPMERRS